MASSEAAIGAEAAIGPDAGVDLGPVPPDLRTMTAGDIAGFWVSMVISIPSFYLAGGLVERGMSCWQALASVLAGNAVLLLPLLLTAAAGARHGVAFPVLLRAPFGVRGAHAPALLRALVAVGWCAIESWIAAQAITLLLVIPYGGGGPVLDFACFLLFLLAQLAVVVWKGMPGIQALQKYSAPFLAVLTAWLFGWAYFKAGGFGPMLSSPSRLSPSELFKVFMPSVTANVGNWAGMALSIPDFTRYARSQRDQILGQLGFPFFVSVYAFAGLAITSSTTVIFGRLISNPIELLSEIGGTFTTIIAIFGIILAIITTNIPANLVAPANALAALSPSTFGFSGGAAVTTAVAVVFQPWKILGSSQSFVYTWLVGYSAVLGPINGILLADYYLVRGRELDLRSLYSWDERGSYYYWRGYNLAAFAALIAGVAPAVPGFLQKVGVIEEAAGAFVVIYENAWFFGIFTAAGLYWLLSSWAVTNGEGQTAQYLLDPLQHP